MKRRPLLERFASRKQRPNAVVGVGWYTNEHTWAEMKAFAEDPDRYENSYDEWEAIASNTVVDLGKRGLELVKVPIHPEAFREWLQARGEKNNASSRAAYASEKVSDFRS